MTKPHYSPPPNAENAALLSAMDREAHENDWPSRQHVYAVIIDSVLLLPVAELPAGLQCGETISEQPLDVRLAVKAKPTGEKWVAVFTDAEALREWDPTSSFVRAGARAIFKVMLDVGIDLVYLNLFRELPTRPGGWLARSEFEMLAAGTLPVRRGDHHVEMSVGAESAMTIDAPSEPLPKGVVDTLREVSKRLRGLKEVYHFQLSIGGGPAHNALGLRCSGGILALSPDRIVKGLMSRIQPLLGDGQSFDLIVVDRPEHDVIKKGKIVWRKS